MYAQQVQVLINFLILLDGLVVICSGYLAEYIRWVMSDYRWWISDQILVGIIMALMFVNAFVMGRFGFYSDKRFPTIHSLVGKIFVVILVDFSVLGIVMFSLKIQDVSRLFLIIYAAVLLTAFIVVRLAMELYLESRKADGLHARRILLVGSDKRAAIVFDALERQRSWGHKVVGFVKSAAESGAEVMGLPYLGTLDEFDEILVSRSIDEVVFAMDRKGGLKKYMESCEVVGLSYRVVPSMYDPMSLTPLRVENIQEVPVLTWNVVRINATGLLYKRVLDFVVGGVGFLVLALMYPFVALAIKLDSRGPVLFRQVRVGENGRRFKIYKFRTMYVDAELRKRELLENNKMNGFMFKVDDDPRITKVGRILRKTSLDEFPQFINVLKGDMSIVGTRPPLEDEIREYEHWHRRRISMKPGITGLWQISGRSDITDFNEVVRLDLQYIDTWRFIDDLKIILKTILIVFRGKGAC